MPRGGGGSHSSGGGSFGGGGGSHRSSSRSGWTSGSHGSHGHGPMHYGGPRRYHRHGTHIYIGSRPGYATSGSYINESEVMSKLTPEGQTKYQKVRRYERISSLCSILLIFAVFALIFSFITFKSSALLSVDTIKADYKHYHEMIETAKRNPDTLITQGTITKIDKLDDLDKWYFEYSITDGRFVYDDYYIYSVFSDEQIDEYSVGDKIPVAIDESPIRMTTDSIPVVFEQFEYTEDGEYHIAKKNDNLYKTIITIASIVAVGSIVVAIIFSIKKNKLSDTLYQYLTKNESSTSKKKILRCKYCGSITHDANSSCKNCGASVGYAEESDE